MRRRHFLGAAALAPASLAAAAPPEAGPGPGPSASPHNLLVIVCDDLGDGVDGLACHPQSFAPAMEGFFASALRFTNAHAAATLCAPSRAALWSGFAPATSGLHDGFVRGDHWRRYPVLRDAVTVFEHFRGHGYSVAGTGKVFHNGQPDPLVWSRWGSVHGAGVAPSFGPWPWDGKRWRGSKFRRHIVPSPHPSGPPSVGVWGSHARLSDVPVVESQRGWFMDDGTPFRYTSATDRDLLPDELSARWAEDLLGRTHARPFFITVGLNKPHAPVYLPDAYFDLIDAERLTPPPVLADDLADVPRVALRRSQRDGPLPSSGLPAVMRRHGPDHWRRWLQAWLASVAFADAQIGRILAALDRGPHAHSTVVLLTSDHGYHLGDKARVGKNTLWETATRVPLAIRIPGGTGRGQLCDVPVSLLDVYPTLTALCGLPPPDAVQAENAPPLDGESLAPLLERPSGDTWTGRGAALTALRGGARLAPGWPAAADAQHYSLRTRRWRYTRYAAGEQELYDHRTDPHEWRNLAGDPLFAEQRERLRARLDALLAPARHA